MTSPNNSHDSTAILVHSFSSPRLAEYRAYCAGDLKAALDLYRWNAEITGALWETVGHLEVALRNTLATRLADRHRRLRRAGSWLDDPAGEFDHQAHLDIAKARSRVQRKRKPASDPQTISELTFGFWRYLLAKRYTNLWPDLASGFPCSPNRSRTTIERPVHRMHLLRNRLAHHQRVWTEPLSDRWTDLCVILCYIDPTLCAWVTQGSRAASVLTTCPITRPYP